MNTFPNRKYKTIYADPPWQESGGGKIKRGADKHYLLIKNGVNYESPGSRNRRRWMSSLLMDDE